MAYIVTPVFGMKLADPATVQQFETTVVNDNFLALESGIVADRVRLTTNESNITTLQGKPSFNSQVTNFEVLDPAALDALTTAAIGDTAAMTSPGTGIDPFMWFAFGGTGGGLDWRPMETIQASSKTNMDAFIVVVAAIADTRFQVGAEWVDMATGLKYAFTTAAGAYRPLNGIVYARQEATTGTITASTWTIRPLTHLTVNEIPGASLAANVLTLPAGTYEVSGHFPAFACNVHQVRLRRTSNTAATLLAGSLSAADATVAQGVVTESFLNGRITLTATETLEVQHWCSTTRATNGMGVVSASGETQVLGELIIRRIL